MIVCSCRRVNAAAIEAAIGAGAGDVDAVARACGAGTRCGGCWPTLEALIERVAPPRAA